MIKEASKTEDKKEEASKPKGKFTPAIGRRKRAVARVRLHKNGKGNITVNGVKLGEYFTADLQSVARQPLKLTGRLKDHDISILAAGGGKRGQAEAVRHGIAQALIKTDQELRTAVKAKGYLTRDARKKERKKPGLKKARRAPQWSKR